MTASGALLATEHVLATWQRRGCSFDPVQYLDRLAAAGRSDRYEALKQVAEDCGIPRAETFAAVALAALANQANWCEQVIHFLLLPYLRDNLHRGPAAAGLAAPWMRSPLDLVLCDGHVRALAAQVVCGHPLDVERHRAILALYKATDPEARSAALDRLDSEIAGLLGDPDTCAVLAEALRFWDTEEMVPAMAVRMLPPGDAAWAPDRLLKQMAAAAAILGGTGGHRDEHMAGLRLAIGAMACRTVSGSEPFAETFVYQLLDHQDRLCQTFGAPAAMGTADWYRTAAQLIEEHFTGPTLSMLRRTWAQDVTGGWTGARCGAALVPELYRAWCQRLRVDHPGTAALGQWLRSSPGGADDLILPLLEGRVLNLEDIGAAAERTVYTLPMLQGPLPERIRLVLLERLLLEHGEIGDHRSILAAWAETGDPLCRAVGRAAQSTPQGTHPAWYLLLWEVALSPPVRRPALAARVQRQANLARLRRWPRECIAEMAKLLGLLL